MSNIRKAMDNLNRTMSDKYPNELFPFEEFLKIMTEKPSQVIRNTFQMFHDMIRYYVKEGADEYPDDPESIHYVYYDCNRLFVEDADHPFFADRLFANRFINHIEALRRGAQQNKIYIFDGPPGCGKSTFLNNLLKKHETYANTPEGMRYETVWRLSRKALGSFHKHDGNPMLDNLYRILSVTSAAKESREFNNDETSRSRSVSMKKRHTPMTSTRTISISPAPAMSIRCSSSLKDTGGSFSTICSKTTSSNGSSSRTRPMNGFSETSPAPSAPPFIRPF